MRRLFFVRRATVGAAALIHALSVTNAWACENPKTPNDLLECVKSSHADIQVQRQGILAAERGVDAAAQLKNPELELESIPQSGGGWGHDAKLLLPIELGGKRSSRRAQAASAISQARAELLQAQEAAIVEAVSDLYRLRQLNTELAIAGETAETFRGVTGTYSRAGRLNPEQEVSFSVFQLAADEASLRKLALVSERDRIIAGLEGATGLKLPSDYSRLLPAMMTDWPELTSQSQLGGSSVQLLTSSLEQAQAGYNLEKSLAWPDLFLGPAFAISTGEAGESKIGVAVTFDLPVLSFNKGAKAQAAAVLQRSEFAQSAQRPRFERELASLYSLYRSSAEAMRSIAKSKSVEARHGNLHRLLGRGVISAPLVIELHRQMSDFTEKVHEQERQGIEALWRIYALEGRILKEVLK